MSTNNYELSEGNPFLSYLQERQKNIDEYESLEGGSGPSGRDVIEAIQGKSLLEMPIAAGQAFLESDRGRTMVKELLYGYTSADMNNTRAMIHSHLVNFPESYIDQGMQLPDGTVIDSRNPTFWKEQQDGSWTLEKLVDEEFIAASLQERKQRLHSAMESDKIGTAKAMGISPHAATGGFAGYGWARLLGTAAAAVSDPLLLLPILGAERAVQFVAAARAGATKAGQITGKQVAGAVGGQAAMGAGFAGADYAINTYPYDTMTKEGLVASSTFGAALGSSLTMILGKMQRISPKKAELLQRAALETADDALQHGRTVTAKDLDNAIDELESLVPETVGDEVVEAATKEVKQTTSDIAYIINKSIDKEKANPIHINVDEAGVSVVPNTITKSNNQILREISNESSFVNNMKLAEDIEFVNGKAVAAVAPDIKQKSALAVAQLLDDIDKMYLPSGKIFSKGSMPFKGTASSKVTPVTIDPSEKIISKAQTKKLESAVGTIDESLAYKELLESGDYTKAELLGMLKNYSEDLDIAMDLVGQHLSRKADVDNLAKMINLKQSVDTTGRKLNWGDLGKVDDKLEEATKYFSDAELEKSWDRHAKDILSANDKTAGQVMDSLEDLRTQPEYNAIINARRDEEITGFVNQVKDLSQSGFIDQSVLMHLGTGAASGLLTYSVTGDPYLAIAGAVAGGFAPYAIKKALGMAPIPAGMRQTKDRVYGTLDAFWTGWTTGGFARQVWSKPRNLLNRLGASGKVFSTKLERAHDNYTIAMMRNMTKVNSIFEKAKLSSNTAEGIEGLHKLRDILTHKTRLQDEPNEKIRTAAKELHKIFNQLIRDEKKVGLIDAKVFANTAAIRQEQGFFPFVLDDVFLSSGKGKDAWVDSLVKKSIPEEEMDILIKSVVGRGSGATKVIKEIKQGLTLDFATGTVTIADWAARLLVKNRSANPFSMVHGNTPMHIIRKHLGDFEVVNPFVAIQDYMNYTHRRIEYANLFGAKGHIAKHLADNIQSTFAGRGGTKLHDYALEVYYLSARDVRSSTIQKAAAMAPWQKNLIGAVKSYETLKLITAAIINLGQASVNGSVMMTHMTGNPMFSNWETLKATFRMMHDMQSMKGGESRAAMLAETGAALETELLKMVGEAASRSHSILPEHLFASPNKILNSLLWAPRTINNPTKFLSTVGFLGSERYVRAVAAAQGQALLTYLAKNKAKYAAKSPNHPKLKQINEAISELGVNPNNIRNHNDIDDFSRASAGLRFSNRTNFTTATHEMPLWWQQSGAPELFRQFKSFALSQGEFVEREVMKPARKGLGKLLTGHPIESIPEFLPMLQYAAIGTAVGGTAMTAKQLTYMLLGDDRDLTMTENYFKGIMYVGGIGLVTDAAQNFAHNNRAPMSAAVKWVAGPAIGDAMEIGDKLRPSEPENAFGLGAAGEELIRGTNTPARLVYDNFMN